MTEPDLLTRLRQNGCSTDPEFLSAVIDEIIQLRAAVAMAERAAARWQARAEQAERNLGLSGSATPDEPPAGITPEMPVVYYVVRD